MADDNYEPDPEIVRYVAAYWDRELEKRFKKLLAEQVALDAGEGRELLDDFLRKRNG